jgi:protein TonB
LASTIHNDNSRPDEPPRRTSPGRPSVRLPLGERKRLQRRAARLLIARRTRQPPTAEQRAFDPLTRPAHRLGRRRLGLTLAIVGSLALHAGALAFGLAMRVGLIGPKREQVAIEMRQKPPEPPPPENKPEPPAPIEKPAPRPPKVAKAPPPPEAPPPPTKVTPVRVVGLSLESTNEGGDGPAFAVGNTRLGETDKKAVAPKDLTPAPAAPPSPVTGPSRSNQAASHIPVAGVKYEKPKPKSTPEPEYPSDLKSQGIEADVMVLATIGTDGKIINVKIIKEAPYPAFNEAARAAVLKYEYEPALRDGVAMEFPLSFTVRFRLKDNE